MRNSLVGAVAMVLAGGGTGISSAPLAAADSLPCTPSSYCAFLSPSYNTSCEIDYQYSGIPDGTFCYTGSPPQSVHMDTSGALTVCTGESCLANAAPGTPTLGYGQTVGSGPFTCLSEASGVTCRVAASRGFTIASSGVTPVG